MKIILASFLILLSMSACSKSPSHQGSYERANQASEKAHRGLDSSF